MSDEIGFRSVPWTRHPLEPVDWFPQVDLAELDQALAGDCCTHRWPGKENWACTRPIGHTGTCRASTARHVLAEWYAEAMAR